MKEKIVLILFVFVWFFSCKQLEIKRINKVETIKSIFYNNQIIAKGKIIDIEENGISDYGFCYAANNSFPTINDDRISLGATKNIGEFSANLIGLQALKKLYYRSYVISKSNQIKYGNILSVDIIPKDLNVFLDSISVGNSGKLNIFCRISGIGKLDIQEFGYCWLFWNNPTVLNEKVNFGKIGNDTSIVGEIINPVIDTFYYFKTYAKIDEQTYYYSSQKYIKLSSLKIRTDNIGEYNLANMIFYGYLDEIGNIPIQEYGFCYSSTNSFPSLNDNKIIVFEQPKIGFYSAIVPFITNTTYYVRSYAIVGNKIIYGQVKSKSF
jgi:hypothetical protein